MPRRAARWILWLTFAFVVPVPFFMVVTGRVPAARLIQLGAVSGALIAVEGPQGVVGIVAGLLLLQGLVALGVLWLAADLVSRALGRYAPRRVAAGTAVVVIAALLTAALLDIYRTPFRRDAPRATLLHVFD